LVGVHTTIAYIHGVQTPQTGAFDVTALHIVSWENMIWGRCYDHNFLRFLPIFGEKIGVFLKNQCYDPILHNLDLFLAKNANFFAKFFSENIL
jgi:hypothetical protein